MLRLANVSLGAFDLNALGVREAMSEQIEPGQLDFSDLPAQLQALNVPSYTVWLGRQPQRFASLLTPSSIPSHNVRCRAPRGQKCAEKLGSGKLELHPDPKG